MLVRNIIESSFRRLSPIFDHVNKGFHLNETKSSLFFPGNEKETVYSYITIYRLYIKVKIFNNKIKKKQTEFSELA